MQNTKSFLEIIVQLDKLKSDLELLLPSANVSQLEKDLSLEKLRIIYDLILSQNHSGQLRTQTSIPVSKETGPITTQESTLNVEGQKVEKEKTNKETKLDEIPEVDENVPSQPIEEEKIEPIISPEETQILEDQEKSKEPEPNETTKEPDLKALSFQEEILEEPEQPVENTPEIKIPKSEIIVEPEPTPIEEPPIPQSTKESKTRKTTIQKITSPEKSKKVIGEQLGADKKSLYDLISGAKANQDIVSQYKKKPVTDIHKAVSLNDKIWFMKELFNGDAEIYKSYIDKLNVSNDLEQALDIITSNFSWDSESRVVQKFLSIVSRRFI